METTLDTAEQSAERIGFGKRLGAWIIDLVLQGVAGGIIGSIAGATLVGLFFAEMASSDMGANDIEAAAVGGVMGMLGGIIGTVAGMYLMMFVFMIIEAFTGATPGKMILGIKIANADATSASTGSLLTRAALKNIGVLLAIVAGLTGVAIIATLGSLGGLAIFIGCFFVLGDKRQGFHDMIGKTAVFNKKDIK